MEIGIDEEWLKVLYDVLVDIYKETDTPITVGYNEGMINVCVERPQTGIYDFIPFPHFLHKVAVLMETIIDFHPFADGNKRVALLATFYFMHWNEYDFFIPENADDFTIAVAKHEKKLNDILSWLVDHSKRGFFSILRNKICYVSISFWGKYPILGSLIEPLIPLFVPLYPLMFFRYKIMSRRRKRK